MSDDARLILRLQSGDLEALGQLFDRHRMPVFRTALAITRDQDAAEDILQDVFLRLHTYVHRVDTSLPLSPWLYRITVNLSYTWVTRRNKWMAPLEDFVDQLIGPAKYCPEPEAERRDETRSMQRAIDALPFNQRVVIVLYYLNELSLQEIGNILSVPVGTIKSRLHYGRENLRRQLQASSRAPEVQYEFT
ncbi:MAG TPA: sigma-70 family RNA polymerase sigma factor [Chloroflexia bacterium]|nr:sigma-70 family RNA polymerase sigma factor [Chloroflexia bacterium]